MRGTVKFFNRERDYGRITPDDGEGEVVFTGRSLGSSDVHLAPGDCVEFDVLAVIRRFNIQLNHQSFLTKARMAADSGQGQDGAA